MKAADGVRRAGERPGRWGALLLLAVGLGCVTSPEQGESPAMAKAREALREAKARRGNLLLQCEPADAEVYLDGVLQGVCTDFGGGPRGLQVGVGLHRIDVKKEGYWPYTTYYEAGSARAGLTVRLRSTEPSP